MAAITPVSTGAVRPLAGQSFTRKFTVGAAISAGMGALLQSDGFIDPTGVSSAAFVGIVVTTNGLVTFAVGDVADVVYFGRIAGFSGLTPGLPVYLAASGALATDDAGKLVGYCDTDESIFITRSYTTDVS